jgi:hypothetical protein
MDQLVGPDELVARFVFENNKLGSDRVKWRAFWDPAFDISVSRIDGLEDREIWLLTSNDSRGLAIARGDLKARYVRNRSLNVVRDEPPERHALIVGWPRTNKAQMQSLAKELAAGAQLARRV